jgi:hypothetical protein
VSGQVFYKDVESQLAFFGRSADRGAPRDLEPFPLKLIRMQRAAIDDMAALALAPWRSLPGALSLKGLYLTARSDARSEPPPGLLCMSASFGGVRDPKRPRSRNCSPMDSRQ